MTKTQAALLQTKWKQQGDPPPACQHRIQELASFDLSHRNYVVNTYHCRYCGELLLHWFKAQSLSDTLLAKPEDFDEL